VNRRPTILVCDDEAWLRELMKVALGEKYNYAEATDAAEAMDALHTVRPSLVLLDVMLPGRSGLDVLRDIRADPSLEALPVVVVSAWRSPQDTRVAIEAGADGFLGKPFKVEELVEIVSALLTERA
jgi:DNA-binding response OmpR family regulator